MNLTKFGFFRQLPKEAAIKELNRLRSEHPRPSEHLVLAYLKGGTRIFMVPGIAIDLLSEHRRVIGAPDIYTDGVWTWSADVPFYIEEYHIDIPEEFRLRMEQNGWVCPPITETQGLRAEGWQV